MKSMMELIENFWETIQTINGFFSKVELSAMWKSFKADVNENQMKQ